MSTCVLLHLGCCVSTCVLLHLGCCVSTCVLLHLGCCVSTCVLLHLGCCVSTCVVAFRVLCEHLCVVAFRVLCEHLAFGVYICVVCCLCSLHHGLCCPWLQDIYHTSEFLHVLNRQVATIVTLCLFIFVRGLYAGWYHLLPHPQPRPSTIAADSHIHFPKYDF